MPRAVCVTRCRKQRCDVVLEKNRFRQLPITAPSTDPSGLRSSRARASRLLPRLLEQLLGSLGNAFFRLRLNDLFHGLLYRPWTVAEDPLADRDCGGARFILQR